MLAAALKADIHASPQSRTCSCVHKRGLVPLLPTIGGCTCRPAWLLPHSCCWGAPPPLLPGSRVTSTPAPPGLCTARPLLPLLLPALQHSPLRPQRPKLSTHAAPPAALAPPS